MTCRPTTRPFNRAHVGVAWMLAAGLICAACFWLVGCAHGGPNGMTDNGCPLIPMECM